MPKNLNESKSRSRKLASFILQQTCHHAVTVRGESFTRLVQVKQFRSAMLKCSEVTQPLCQQCPTRSVTAIPHDCLAHEQLRHRSIEVVEQHESSRQVADNAAHCTTQQELAGAHQMLAHYVYTHEYQPNCRCKITIQMILPYS